MALDERSGQLGREVGQRRVRFDLLGSRMDAYFAPIAFDIADPARLDKHYPASKPNAQGLARVGLEPLERAAQRVVQVVLRERLAPRAVEAMFFGASGLLTLYPHDAYTLDLARDFEYLAAKYDIEPLDAGVWELDEIRPANHPVLRLAQAAEFFIQDEFVMERAMSCRTEEDIRRLFCIEASAYWRTHHIPGIASDEHPKRLGAFKANIIGINLVSVLQFAYGSVTGRETLRDSALTLLERLPAEDNRYMRNWRNTGVSIRNAFESQALLQLATEYCPAKRCTECPVGRRILQSISSTE